MFIHKCLKPGCENSYEDEEIDAFYCPSCNSLRKQIAHEMDRKFNTKGQEPSGAIIAYDQARGTRAFPTAAALGFKI